MRLLPAAGVIAAAIAAAALIFTPWAVEAPPPGPGAEQAPAAAAPAVEPVANTVVTRPQSTRQIAPDRFPMPPASDRPLGRDAPRAPLGPLGQARAPEPPDADAGKTVLLHRPVATAAGRIEAQGHDIVIAGVKPTPPDRRCAASGGGSEPCGMRARTAFRNWLRGRAIACDVPAAPTGTRVVARCALGGRDAGAWLVENGWAEASGAALAAVEDEARQRRRGLFAYEGAR